LNLIGGHAILKSFTINLPADRNRAIKFEQVCKVIEHFSVIRWLETCVIPKHVDPRLRRNYDRYNARFFFMNSCGAELVKPDTMAWQGKLPATSISIFSRVARKTTGYKHNNIFSQKCEGI
jgi:hypothetical protein